MRYEDISARDDYFARLERIDEIMAGDPEYDREEAKRIAKRGANTFSGGDCTAKSSAPSAEAK